jgi:hypothetical protein
MESLARFQTIARDRSLPSLVQRRHRPMPGETVAASAGSASKSDSKTLTSKKYFQHVSPLIDTIGTDAPKAGSLKLARRMVDNAALEIDRLPVLNVHEDLIAYGAEVSSTLRNMRNLSNYASVDANFRQASIAGIGAPTVSMAADPTLLSPHQ